jgi:hypothetical protein
MKWCDSHGWSQSNPTGAGSATTDPVGERAPVALECLAEGPETDGWMGVVENQPRRTQVKSNDRRGSQSIKGAWAPFSIRESLDFSITVIKIIIEKIYKNCLTNRFFLLYNNEMLQDNITNNKGENHEFP